jgi:D-cysteine desulfhydrase
LFPFSFCKSELVLFLDRGYIEAIREIEHQIQISGDVQFDDIVVACGSGGTIAGLALGSKLSSLKAKVCTFFDCFLSC